MPLYASGRLLIAFRTVHHVLRKPRVHKRQQTFWLSVMAGLIRGSGEALGIQHDGALCGVRRTRAVRTEGESQLSLVLCSCFLMTSSLRASRRFLGVAGLTAPCTEPTSVHRALTGLPVRRPRGGVKVLRLYGTGRWPRCGGVCSAEVAAFCGGALLLGRCHAEDLHWPGKRPFCY